MCFGDSLTWGYTPVTGERYPEGVRWTSLLGDLLHCVVIEEGLNGRTTVFKDSLFPFLTGADYIQACVLSHSPLDLLIIMLGINDMKPYICNVPDASARGSVSLAHMAKAVQPGLDIVLVSPPPIGRHITELDPELGMMAQLNQESIEHSWQLGGYMKLHAEDAGFYFLDAADFVTASEADAVHLDKEANRQLAQAIANKIRSTLL